MKKFLLFILGSLILSGCGINRQLKSAKAFEDCKYNIGSADSLYVAGMNVMNVINSQSFNVVNAPRLALALLRKDVPLEGRVNLQIKNPSGVLAAINQFEYKVLIKGRELASGVVDRAVRVAPNGGVTTVPIQISSNVYSLLSDSKTQQAIADFFTDSSGAAKKSVLTIKIKPTIGVGQKLIKYPGYISIDREITKKILL